MVALTEWNPPTSLSVERMTAKFHPTPGHQTPSIPVRSYDPKPHVIKDEGSSIVL